MIKLFEQIFESGKTQTWNELGKEFKLTGEQLRKRYNRWRNSRIENNINNPLINPWINLIHTESVPVSKTFEKDCLDNIQTILPGKKGTSFKIKLECDWFPKSQEVKQENILVIPDLHEPFTHPNAFEFIKQVRDKYNCTKIVFIGDIVDFAAYSYHEKNPNMPSAKDELTFARQELKKWHDEFPNAVVLRGNHCSLFSRKAMSAGLPEELLRPLNEILHVPTWKFQHEYIYNDILFMHGTGLSATSINQKALYNNKSVVIGHLHTTAKIEHLRNDLFTMTVGCLIDYSHEAFNYAKTNPKNPIMSCGVIVDGTPTIITMK